MIIAGIVLAAIAAVGAIAGGVIQQRASNEALAQQEQAIESNRLKNKYDTLTRKNETLSQMKIQLQRNEAHQTVTGSRSNSPSFFMQQAEEVKQGREALQKATTAQALTNYSLDIQKRNAQSQHYFSSLANYVQIGTGVAQAAGKGYQAYQGVPAQ